MSASIHLQRPVQEFIDFEAVFLFKAPAEAAAREVAAPCRVLEAAPGVALFGVGLQRIRRVSFGDLRDIHKLYTVWAVHPRYDLGTATPRFSFFVRHIYATPAAFEAQIDRINRDAPYGGGSLEMTIDEAALAIGAADADGPILELAIKTPPPAYRELEMWNQTRKRRPDGAFIQTTHWRGEGFEHTGAPEVGTLHPHPVFGSLDVRGLGSACYHQLIARPGAEAVMTLYAPVEDA